MKNTTSFISILLSFLMVSAGLISCKIEPNKPFPKSNVISTTQNINTKNTQEIEGTVLETDIIPGDNEGLFFFIQDDNESNYAIDFLEKDNPSTFAALPKDLEGAKIKAVYRTKVEPVVVDIVPVNIKSSFIGGVFEKMTTYTLKATQLKVEESEEGLNVTIQLASGKERTYRTDLEAYNDQDPSDHNGKPVNLTYIEDKRLLMQDLKVL